MAITGDVHVKVNSVVLNSKAQSVSKSITNMMQCFEDLEKVIKRTSGYWIGEAGDLHRKIYQEQKSQIDEMMKRLKEHPTDLMTIAQTYDIAESEVRSMAAELPGNVIS